MITMHRYTITCSNVNKPQALDLAKDYLKEFMVKDLLLHTNGQSKYALEFTQVTDRDNTMMVELFADILKGVLKLDDVVMTVETLNGKGL